MQHTIQIHKRQNKGKIVESMTKRILGHTHDSINVIGQTIINC